MTSKGILMAIRLYSEIVKRAVQTYEDNTALFIHRNGEYKSWTYNQFNTDMNKVAESLRLRGFSYSDNAIIIGSNTPEWIIAFHSTFFAGKCAVPVDPNLPREDIEEILHRTKATVVFCDSAYVSLFEQLQEQYPALQTIVLLNGDESSESSAVTYQSLLEECVNPPSVFTRQFSPDDPISILFTSGTTGHSKGVVLTQKNYCSIAENGLQMMGVSSDERIMAVLPLYHVFGFASTIACAMMNGIDVVCIPEVKGPAIVKAMNDLSVTALPAVPQMLTLILENIKRGVAQKGAVTKIAFEGMLRLSRVVKPIARRTFQRKLFKAVHDGFGGKFRIIISGGASLDRNSFRDYQALGFDIVEGYGLTETFGPITLCPITRQVQGAVGELIGDNEGKINNPDSDGWGEVLFRGDSVFSCYLDDEEATNEVFDTEGWFRTGDRGRFVNGLLSLSGRLKDVIVLDSGKNVYPDEMEHYYESSAAIEEIGIFALEEKNHITVAALIVAKDHGRSGSDEEMHALVSDEMKKLSEGRPDYKRVSTYHITDVPLPRTSTKKIKKHLLPELYKQLQNGVINSQSYSLTAIQSLLMASEHYQSMVSILESSLLKPLNEDQKYPTTELLRDLGIDSLRLLDIVAKIEKKRGIIIEEDALVQVRTLEDLSVLIKDAKKSDTVRSMKEILEQSSDSTIFKDKKGFFASLFFEQFKMFSSLVWGYRSFGIENIPKDRTVLFAANHESMFDGAWLYAALPGIVRKKSYSLIKDEIMTSKVLSHLFSGTNIISVERESDAMASLKLSYAALKSGRNVIIFPEGTRSTDGEIHEFRSGIGVLMRELDVAVVPVRIINSAKKWPKGSSPRFFSGWKERPSVQFGKAITLKELHCEDELDESIIAEAVRQSVIKL